MLHNILLAMGVGFLNVEKKVREQLALAFGARAKALLEEETEQAMLSTVSGVLLLATFHASLSRHSLGFIYTGVGMRLIQACEWARLDARRVPLTSSSGHGLELRRVGCKRLHQRGDNAAPVQRLLRELHPGQVSAV